MPWESLQRLRWPARPGPAAAVTLAVAPEVSCRLTLPEVFLFLLLLQADNGRIEGWQRSSALQEGTQTCPLCVRGGRGGGGRSDRSLSGSCLTSLPPWGSPGQALRSHPRACPCRDHSTAPHPQTQPSRAQQLPRGCPVGWTRALTSLGPGSSSERETETPMAESVRRSLQSHRPLTCGQSQSHSWRVTGQW